MTLDLQLDSRILIQGWDNPFTRSAIERMQAHNTNIIGMVSPGQGEQKFGELPMFDLVKQAQSALGQIDTSLIFMPPYEVLDAALEAISAGIPQIIIVTQGVPPLDLIRLLRQAKVTNTLILGSGSAGIIVPGKLLLGTYRAELFKPGKVAIITRHQSLSAEIASVLNRANLGQSIVIHLGSDRLVGSSCLRCLESLQAAENTQAIILVGDIYWDSCVATSAYFLEQQHKPIVAYLAGIHASKPQPLIDIPVVLSHTLSKPIYDVDTIDRRMDIYKQAKIPIAKKISQIPNLLKKLVNP